MIPRYTPGQSAELRVLLNTTLKGPGADSIISGPEEDVVRAGAGADLVSVGYEDDGADPNCVECGPGNDTIRLTMLKIAQRDAYQNCEETKLY